jgi:hypothetical protein
MPNASIAMNRQDKSPPILEECVVTRNFKNISISQDYGR